MDADVSVVVKELDMSEVTSAGEIEIISAGNIATTGSVGDPKSSVKEVLRGGGSWGMSTATTSTG